MIRSISSMPRQNTLQMGMAWDVLREPLYDAVMALVDGEEDDVEQAIEDLSKASAEVKRRMGTDDGK